MIELVRSYFKKRKLATLMKRLAVPPPGFVQDECMLQVDDSLSLARKADQTQAENELIQGVFQDPELARFVLDQNITEEKLRTIFHSLTLYGAGQWVNGVYVAVAAIATRPSLDYLMGRLDYYDNFPEIQKWPKISDDMVKFFEHSTHNRHG